MAIKSNLDPETKVELLIKLAFGIPIELLTAEYKLSKSKIINLRKNNYKLYNTFFDYWKIDKFYIESLESNILTLEQLDMREKYWINYYNATNPKKGYNMMEGGTGGALVGEALQRMKLSKKGKPHSEKQKARGYKYLKGINLGIKNPMYGKKPANANKTMEEFFGTKKALEIKEKLRIQSRIGMYKSKKYLTYIQKLKEKYYTCPNYCKRCGKLIEYTPGYKYKYCKSCKRRRNSNESKIK